MTNVAHVVPNNDLIEHDWQTEEATCVCGPTTRPIKRDDGTVGWVITHNSLDGREAHEQEDAMHEAPGPRDATLVPEKKVAAAGVSAAAATLIIFITGLFGLEVTAEQAAAAVTVVAFVAAYLAPHTRRGADA